MGTHPSNETHLSAWWSKREKDIVFSYPHKPDGHLLYGFMSLKRPRRDLGGDVVFDPSFLEELEVRGYDITTLRFSVRRKTTP